MAVQEYGVNVEPIFSPPILDGLKQHIAGVLADVFHIMFSFDVEHSPNDGLTTGDSGFSASVELSSEQLVAYLDVVIPANVALELTRTVDPGDGVSIVELEKDITFEIANIVATSIRNYLKSNDIVHLKNGLPQAHSPHGVAPTINVRFLDKNQDVVSLDFSYRPVSDDRQSGPCS